MTAWHLSSLTYEQQCALVRELATQNLNDHDIARLLNWNVIEVRRALAEQRPDDTGAARFDHA